MRSRLFGLCSERYNKLQTANLSLEHSAKMSDNLDGNSRRDDCAATTLCFPSKALLLLVVVMTGPVEKK